MKKAFLYDKHIYFLNLLFNERNELFKDASLLNSNSLIKFDADKFFDSREFVIIRQQIIRREFRNCKENIRRLLIKFRQGKKQIRIKYYTELLLNKNLCLDVINIIISYLY